MRFMKQQQLAPLQLIQRLLLHVPATGVNIVRYYGLYEPASKQKHQKVLSLYGNLKKRQVRRSLDLNAVLLHCKTQETPVRLQKQVWRRMLDSAHYACSDQLYECELT